MSSAINEANFKDARRGYNKKEVRAYLADLEAAFSEMEGHARESARRIGDLEHMVGEMKATEAKSMDNAMYAVFDAKDRILEKANRRAEKIENEAREKADELLADVKEMLDATRGVQTDGPDSVSPEAVLIAAREEAAQIREEAARYAATVSDGDVETITEELAKARADAIAERARAEKYEELSRSQAVELGDLNRDQGDGTPDEGLAEARAQGTNIIAQAQTEAESILQRASDEARTVRDLARQETDRAAASAAIRELAYGSDPVDELATARDRIVELELQLSSDSPTSDTAATEELLDAEARIAVLEADLAAAHTRLDSVAAVEDELESLRAAANDLEALRDERDVAQQSLAEVAEVQTELTETKATLEQRSAELAESLTTIEGLRSSVDDDDGAVARVMELEQQVDELGVVQDAVAGLEEALAKSKADLAESLTLAEQLEARVAEAAVTQERLIVVEGELAEATASVEVLTQQITDNAEQSSDAAAKLADSESTQAELRALEERLTLREQELEGQRSELSAASDVIAQEKSSLSDAWQRLDSEREIVNAGMNRVELASEDAEKIQELTAERDQLQAQLDAALTDLETERKSVETKVSALVEEHEQQLADAATIASEHESLVVTSEETASENAAIFARMERHQSDLQATISEVRGERDELAQVNAALEAKVQQLQERTTELAQAAQRSGDDEAASSTEPSGGEDENEDTEEAPVARPFSRGKSRYERNSAKLPRIGDEAGSVLKSMQDLRASLTEE